MFRAISAAVVASSYGPNSFSQITLIECRVGSGLDLPYRIISTDASGLHTVNEDFSCHSLRLIVEDFENGEDAPGLEYWITAEYVEIDPE